MVMSGIAAEGTEAMEAMEARRRNFGDTARTTELQQKILIHAILDQILKACL